MNIEIIRNNLNNYFKDLIFDEENHKYSLKEKDIILTSVSNKIKNFTLPFDKLNNAKNVANKKGLKIEDVLNEWDNIAKKSCELGTKVHLFGENYDGSQEPTNGYERAIVDFFNLLPSHYKLVCNELKMYSEKFKIAGTADLIFLNEKDDRIYLMDWKTNRDLFKNFKGQTLLEPFNNLLDSPFGKYTLQLSFYQILLEQTGYKVSGRALIWLKPDGKFEFHRTENVSDTLLEYLNKEIKNE